MASSSYEQSVSDCAVSTGSAMARSRGMNTDKRLVNSRCGARRCDVTLVVLQCEDLVTYIFARLWHKRIFYNFCMQKQLGVLPWAETRCPSRDSTVSE